MYYHGRFNPMSIIAFPKIAVSRDLKCDCATQFRQRQLTSKTKERLLFLLSKSIALHIPSTLLTYALYYVSRRRGNPAVITKAFASNIHD